MIGGQNFVRLKPGRRLIVFLAVVALGPAAHAGGGVLRVRPGGRLITAQRAEPKTFNPVTTIDAASREILDLMNADLVHINRRSLQTEPALARDWNVSRDGRTYTLHLRRGIRFSDGHPMDADDVLFTFAVCLDERTGAPQRDLLIVDGKPIAVRKIDAYTVRFDLAAPYAAAERIFDSIAILPRHLLEKAYEDGRVGRAWGLDATPDQIAGLGPFRLKTYVPGQRAVLERNPYYWKTDQAGQKLPYLQEIVLQFPLSEELQITRFLTGEIHVLNDVSADNFLELKKRETQGGFRAWDMGPGLQYNFLVLNMNGSEANAALGARHAWFRELKFRKAISAAIDREAIVRLAYRGLADPLWTHVTRGNTLWVNPETPRPARSLSEARSYLRAAAFSWNDGRLVDRAGKAVEFSILTNATNAQRTRIATLIQHDLAELGMTVHTVSLESRTMLDRIFKRHDFEAALLGVESGDADPNSEMNVWLSSGGMHLWNMSGKAQSVWEAEIDGIMRRQMTTLVYTERRRLYSRVQQLVSENLPVICLASPHVLVAATNRLENFKPAVLRHHTLWNAESLYFREEAGRA